MRDLTTWKFRARMAEGEADIRAAQALRHLVFRGRDGVESDRYDATCRHLIIETHVGLVVATLRYRLFGPDEALDAAYSAQFYDLSRFGAEPGSKIEIGRFCLRPEAREGDVLRLAWAALAQIVTGAAARHLFGCSSFAGAEPAPHRPALAHLAATALGPAPLRPAPRGPAIPLIGAGPADPAGLPPLLQFYLRLGGWVADHAIADPDLGTLHVFTALNLASLAPAHARVLANLARHAAAAPGAG